MLFIKVEGKGKNDNQKTAWGATSYQQIHFNTKEL